MKKITLLFIILGLVPSLLFSQTAEDVFEQYWEGGCKYRVTNSESDTFYVGYSMYDVDYNTSDNSFTATMGIKFNFDNATYRSTIKVNGNYYSYDNSVVIKHDYTISQDELTGMEWEYFTLYLVIYQDDEHPGYYIMDGTAEGQEYDDEYEWCRLGTYTY